ncbi:hypothetical protein CDL15_Pgr005586 [Punica granatum]|uniref:Uncharacterized protein n=1 Tax=Punica granatum TaxID=22663 RepID=A0A218WFY3_PUNGR|nr:hypothetical protein CDL15_Pgr005586 [Punica granatum]
MLKCRKRSKTEGERPYMKIRAGPVAKDDLPTACRRFYIWNFGTFLGRTLSRLTGSLLGYADEPLSLMLDLLFSL